MINTSNNKVKRIRIFFLGNTKLKYVQQCNEHSGVWGAAGGGKSSIFIFNLHRILIIIMSISLRMQTLPILTESNMVKGH